MSYLRGSKCWTWWQVWTGEKRSQKGYVSYWPSHGSHCRAGSWAAQTGVTRSLLIPRFGCIHFQENQGNCCYSECKPKQNYRFLLWYNYGKAEIKLASLCNISPEFGLTDDLGIMWKENNVHFLICLVMWLKLSSTNVSRSWRSRHLWLCI